MPEPSPSPTPAAPAPPAASPKPQSDAPATVDTPPIEQPAGEDAYAEIERMANEPKPQRKEAAKPAAPKPPEEGKVPDEKPPEENEPGKEPGRAPPKASELRTAYDRLKKEHAALKAEAETLKKAQKPNAEDPDKPKLLESLKERDARLKELQDEIKYLSYERSDEYKEKYQKPYEETASAATSRAIQLKVPNSETGVSRNLTDKEFWEIVRIGDDDAALSAAEALFGENSTRANFLIERRNEVISAYRRGEQAKEEYRKTSSEREKTELEKRLQQQQTSQAERTKINEQFKTLNQAAIDKYKEWFQPEEGDEVGNKLLAKGFEMADRAFSPNGMNPEKLVKLHSAVRNKAAGFDRLAYKAKSLKSRVAELEKELEEYKTSDPGAAGGTGRQPPGKDMSVEDEIDAMASRR